MTVPGVARHVPETQPHTSGDLGGEGEEGERPTTHMSAHTYTYTSRGHAPSLCSGRGPGHPRALTQIASAAHSRARMVERGEGGGLRRSAAPRMQTHTLLSRDVKLSLGSFATGSAALRLRFLFFVAGAMKPASSNGQSLVFAGLIILRFSTFAGAAHAHRKHILLYVRIGSSASSRISTVSVAGFRRWPADTAMCPGAAFSSAASQRY